MKYESYTTKRLELRNKIKKALGDDEFIDVDILEINGKEFLRLERFVVDKGPTEAILLEITGLEYDSSES